MKPIFCRLVGVVLLLAALGGAQTMGDSPAASNPDVQKITIADNNFGFALLGQLAKATPDGNLFFSPYSLASALTMTYNGAGGQTQQDMAGVLGVQSLLPDTVNHANNALRLSLETPDLQVRISIANALWAKPGTHFAPHFAALALRDYDAKTAALSSNSVTAASQINQWVSGKTAGKITDLVTPEDVAQADAVLTNALYFHGQWKHPFDKKDTRAAPFFLASGARKTVPLMTQQGRYLYLETNEFQAIRLFYGSTSRVSMVAFLPKPSSQLKTLLPALTSANWEQWMTEFSPMRVNISLPRFHAEYAAKLKQPLTALGMGIAFGGPGVDFSPMGLPNDFIADVIHKAVLDVDEEGTTAAAATAIPMMRGAPERIVTMRVDRPFFCILQDDVSGVILFEGVIRDPQPLANK